MPTLEPFTLPTSLLNCIDTVPLPAWYAALMKTGLSTVTLPRFSSSVMPVRLPGTPAARMPRGASTYSACESANHPLAGWPIVAAAPFPVHAPSGSRQSGFVAVMAAERMPSVRVAFPPFGGANRTPL